MATDPRKRQLRAPLGAALLLLTLVLAACGSGGGTDLDPGNAADAPDFSAAVSAAPPKLAKLYEPGGTLLDGGLDAYEAQVAELEGYPIVVNKWASWCGPCRIEFEHFQDQAAEHADEVAFLGIDSDDSVPEATTFLEGHPVPYPSFSDPDQELAESIDAAFAFPTTVFYDRNGEVIYKREGGYASGEDLAADVQKYALSG